MSDDANLAPLGFSFRVTRQGEVEISHRGRKATTLRGNERLAGRHPRNRR